VLLHSLHTMVIVLLLACYLLFIIFIWFLVKNLNTLCRHGETFCLHRCIYRLQWIQYTNSDFSKLA
jgi:hypothetical protein